MFQGLRVAFGVAAVAVEHVEIDKVAEDQAAGIGIEGVDGLVDGLFVILGGQVLGHAERIVDRGDLADTYDVKAGVLQQRQKIIGRRRNGVVVAVLGPFEIGGVAAEKWTRDHAADLVLALQDARGRSRRSHKDDRWE